MEWVETTARTIEEAKDLALDQLGVDVADAEFEIIDEPRAGLFGRMRGEARVRARVRPTQARQKVDRRDRRKKGSGDSDSPAESTTDESTIKGSPAPRSRAPRGDRPATQKSEGRPAKPAQKPSRTPADPTKESDVNPDDVGKEAVQFMDGLVSAFGLSGTTELLGDNGDFEVRVHGENLGLLVGPRGVTLQAVQDLARVASQRRLGDHETRLRVDVGGYRERRREALGRFAVQIADEVKSSGVARSLEPMMSADRKVIHDVLGEIDGIVTRSEGDDPNRRVVIAPANA